MSEPILRVEGLKKRFGANEVLRDISFSINQGDVVCVIGSSGSGKSTLLRCINRLERADGGVIAYRGENVLTRACPPSFYAKVGMVFQQFNLFNNMTVLQNCLAGQMKV